MIFVTKVRSSVLKLWEMFKKQHEFGLKWGISRGVLNFELGMDVRLEVLSTIL